MNSERVEPAVVEHTETVDDEPIGIPDEDLQTYLTAEGVQNPPKALFLGKKRKRPETVEPDFNGSIPQQNAFLSMYRLVWLPEQAEFEKIVSAAPEGKFKKDFLDFPRFVSSYTLKAQAMTLFHRGYPYQKIVALLKELYGSDWYHVH